MNSTLWPHVGSFNCRRSKFKWKWAWVLNSMCWFRAVFSCIAYCCGSAWIRCRATLQSNMKAKSLHLLSRFCFTCSSSCQLEKTNCKKKKTLRFRWKKVIMSLFSKVTLHIWCRHASKSKVMHQMFSVQTITFLQALFKNLLFENVFFFISFNGRCIKNQVFCHLIEYIRMELDRMGSTGQICLYFSSIHAL